MPAPGTRRPVALSLATVLAALAAFALIQYGDALRLPLAGDDWFFIDKTRVASFASVWAPRDLVPAYYRPWSREFHYWALQRLAGTGGWAFHLANLTLWLTAMGLYFTLVRRIAGARAAGLAAAGVAALAGWGVLVVWPSGAQDLWMIVFALGFLHALAARRTAAALAALAFALLSKETAAVLPAVAFAYAWIVDANPPRMALRRAAPGLAVVAVWFMVHPLLGGRLWGVPQGIVPFAEHASPFRVMTGAVLSLANLDALPSPSGEWTPIILRTLGGVVALGALVAIALLTPAPAAGNHPRGSRRAGFTAPARFGLAWTLVAWIPLVKPGLGGHTYYALFGSLGAWIAIGTWISAQPVLALAVVALLPALRATRAATFSSDWGTEWFQRRASGLIATMKTDLQRRHPSFPKGSRLFLADLPGGVSLVASPGYSPALRTWYRDAPPWVGFFTHYRPRAASDTLGHDYFLVCREDGGWHELVVGPEDVSAARRENPHWADYHQHLAEVLYGAGDVKGALVENEKLAAALPQRVEFALNASVCRRALGDSVGAEHWMERAAAAQRAGGSITNE